MLYYLPNGGDSRTLPDGLGINKAPEYRQIFRGFVRLRLGRW